MDAYDYNKVCFVIMPFGEKPVGGEKVNFDAIYDNVFKPAIESVELPAKEGGGRLVPVRTDKILATGSITQDMYEYLEYSRFAVADISGLNANVLYELGVRHRAREAGTAIFRQESGPPPFDIGQIKAFPYEYQPEEKIAESIKLVREVLTQSLEYNSLDSPVQIALRAQRKKQEQMPEANIAEDLRAAEDALNNRDRPTAIDRFSKVLKSDPDNALVLMKRGLLYKDQGDWDDALADFGRAVQASPKPYAEACREKGVAENKKYKDTPEAERAPGMPTGEESLRRAVELNPQDFDALSALGGVLKREGRLDESAKVYAQATDISRGHTYPLLNEIKIRAHVDKKFELDGKRKLMIARAKNSLKVQVENQYNTPWSAFDLAEVCLYSNDPQGFLKYIDEGLVVCTAKWQPKTFRESLELLTSAGISLPGLDEGVAKLKEAEDFL